MIMLLLHHSLSQSVSLPATIKGSLSSKTRKRRNLSTIALKWNEAYSSKTQQLTLQTSEIGNSSNHLKNISEHQPLLPCRSLRLLNLSQCSSLQIKQMFWISHKQAPYCQTCKRMRTKPLTLDSSSRGNKLVQDKKHTCSKLPLL